MFKVADHVLRVSERVVGDRLSRLVMARVTSESRTAVRVGPRVALNLSPWGVRATLGRGTCVGLACIVLVSRGGRAEHQYPQDMGDRS